MRRRTAIELAAGMALALSFSLLPSGGGQHYSAILKNAVKAVTGGGAGGGGGSDSSSARSALALPTPGTEVTFFTGRDLGVSLTRAD